MKLNDLLPNLVVGPVKLFLIHFNLNIQMNLCFSSLDWFLSDLLIEFGLLSTLLLLLTPYFMSDKRMHFYYMFTLLILFLQLSGMKTIIWSITHAHSPRPQVMKIISACGFFPVT